MPILSDVPEDAVADVSNILLVIDRKMTVTTCTRVDWMWSEFDLANVQYEVAHLRECSMLYDVAWDGLRRR